MDAPPAVDAVIRDVRLMAQITASHARSDRTYGAPRILHDLREVGERGSQKRVARLMRRAGLVGVSRWRYATTTRRGPVAQAVPDLVQRVFAAASPNQLCVAEITYAPTWAGFLLSRCGAVFKRRIHRYSDALVPSQPPHSR